MNENADPRALTYAVGASLALHAVLLALRAPESQPPVVPSAPIVAHIAEPEPQPVAPPSPPPPPAVEPPRPLPKREPPKPMPKIVRPAPAPAPSPLSVTPPPAAAPATPSEATSKPEPETPPVQPPAAGPVASAPPAPAAADPSLLIAQYRQQLISAAVRHKRYPLAARDNGWEGDVMVRLEISPSGQLADVKVKRGSGYAVLDEQALEMFRLAAPEVAVPPALRGRAFGFDVRAIYSLKD